MITLNKVTLRGQSQCNKQLPKHNETNFRAMRKPHPACLVMIILDHERPQEKKIGQDTAISGSWTWSLSPFHVLVTALFEQRKLLRSAAAKRFICLLSLPPQGDHSGCSLGFVDNKTKAELSYMDLILKRNLCFDVNTTHDTT